MQPVGPLKLLLLPKQTALLREQLGHANAAGNAISASPASVRHTTEAGVKRPIDTQWEREQS
ncbi:MAG TPA: hypothetical protein VIU62_23805 [Chloroflexota bacterium]